MYEVGTQVRYHGSIEALHGEIFTVLGRYGDRYLLDGVATLRNVRQASITPVEQPGPRAVLERAIADETPVMITYVDAAGEWTTRTIEPYELADTAAGHAIVRAMDHLRGEARSFRLDRIHNLDVLPGSFRLRGDEFDRERDALARIRAEIREVDPMGYGYDAMRWTPDCPAL